MDYNTNDILLSDDCQALRQNPSLYRKSTPWVDEWMSKRVHEKMRESHSLVRLPLWPQHPCGGLDCYSTSYIFIKLITMYADNKEYQNISVKVCLTNILVPYKKYFCMFGKSGLWIWDCGLQNEKPN